MSISATSLYAAINSLQSFAYDVDAASAESITTQADMVYLNSYNGTQMNTEIEWRPTEGTDIQTAFCIMMDKIDSLETRLIETEEELENLKLDQNEEMLEIG